MHVIALVLALGTPSASDTVPLYTDLGSHHFAITTSVPKTQQYFDQGLRLVYGFNHAEAIRAFREGARLDPNCAMCYWGIAYASGPHVNAGMDSASGVEAYRAIQEAMRLAGAVSAREQAYIRVMAQRYAPTPSADRGSLDSAYARAMGDLAAGAPDDLDAQAIYAEALMDLRPWNYWKMPGGEPYPGTETIVSTLERVLATSPDHPGACHFYIHAVEAVAPEKAVRCAERLAQLMPGAGHMVHMPAHIWVRVGRYDDAIRHNEHAVHADEVYIEGQKPPLGVYPAGYYPHNYHFLAFVASLAGRSQLAIATARKTAQVASVDVARAFPELEAYIHYRFLTLVTFGRWDEVLAEPLPPADLRFSIGMASYARGVAFAAKGRWPEARAALDTVRAVAAALPQGINRTVMEIGMHALSGEIAARAGRLDEGIAHFQAAIRIDDAFLYIEPPYWYYPLRHSLGALLLKAGRAAEAEQAYREDLRRFPENGWSLFGLVQALRAQGKSGGAAEVERRFRAAWKDADVVLTASRF